MTQYDATIPHVEIAFPPQVITDTLGEYLIETRPASAAHRRNRKNTRMTFFNSSIEQANPLDRVLIRPKVATCDLQGNDTPRRSPHRSSRKSHRPKLNFANADMARLTPGALAAAVKAIETLDSCVAADRRRSAQAGKSC